MNNSFEPADIFAVFPRLTTDLAQVRDTLLTCVDVGDERLGAPIEHYVRSPGRLFRPALTLTSGYLVDPKAPSDALVTAAVAGELLHLATLCHDDLCDDATTRRGSPSVNTAFGNAEALVAGDYLLASSLAGFSSLGVRPLQIITSALQAICLGQLRETQDLYNRCRSEQSYLVSITGKTAELMAACAQIGAFIAEADEEAQACVASYARNLGIAFQIWDDIRDIWSPADDTGKLQGKDLDNGVFTLPVIYAFQANRAEFEHILDNYPHGGERQALIRSLLDRYGVQERSVQAARRYIRAGLRALGELPSASEDLPGMMTAVARALMPEASELLVPSNDSSRLA